MSGCTEQGKVRVCSSVTVIVLTYGGFKGLERTLLSINEQTYPIDTIIVSDDGSNEAFPPDMQERFTNIHFQANEKNLGTVKHMNVAASGTQSEYIKFLAEGDAFADPCALEMLIAFADNEDAPAVTSQAMVCTEKLNHRLYPFPGRRARRLRGSGMEVFRMLSRSNLISAPGTLFRRSFFTQLGGLDESYWLLEDWPTWLQLSRKGYSIPFLNRVTCLHATGGISSENMDAYHAPKLQRDMALCYEKEIMPYMEVFSSDEVKRIQYGYDVVRGLSHEKLVEKYGWLERRSAWKRGVKRWLLKR